MRLLQGLRGYHARAIAWSGDRILYTSTDGGRQSIMSVAPVPGGVPQDVVAGARTPSGTSDGRAIVFAALEADRGNEILRAGAVDRADRRRDAAQDPIVDFAWSRDGKRLAVLRESTSSDIVLIKGLRRK